MRPEELCLTFNVITQIWIIKHTDPDVHSSQMIFGVREFKLVFIESKAFKRERWEVRHV